MEYNIIRIYVNFSYTSVRRKTACSSLVRISVIYNIIRHADDNNNTDIVSFILRNVMENPASANSSSILQDDSSIHTHKHVYVYTRYRLECFREREAGAEKKGKNSRRGWRREREREREYKGCAAATAGGDEARISAARRTKEGSPRRRGIDKGSVVVVVVDVVGFHNVCVCVCSPV